jgi:hypothetical protein
MVRRKGEVTNTRRNRTHPFQVQIAIPERGLGQAMDAMLRWAAMHDYETMGSDRTGRQIMHWCFKSADKANAFQAEFGGQRIDKPVAHFFEPEQPPSPQELARRQRMARWGLEEIEAGRQKEDTPGMAV